MPFPASVYILLFLGLQSLDTSGLKGVYTFCAVMYTFLRFWDLQPLLLLGLRLYTKVPAGIC